MVEAGKWEYNYIYYIYGPPYKTNEGKVYLTTPASVASNILNELLSRMLSVYILITGRAPFLAFAHFAENFLP